MGRKSAVPTIADGTYFIIAVADHFGSVAELKENNNDKSRKIVIGPDLGFSAPTSPASATVGSTITVSETTKNAAGASPAGASTTRVYLSLDNKFSISDTLLSS